MMCKCICDCGSIKYVEPARVFNKKLKSCGCLNNSENLSKRHRQWYKDNPEKVIEKSKKVSDWYKNNPEKAAEYHRKHSEKMRSNQ